jgi:DNA topoisomerase IA
LHGNGYVITWAVGHLAALAQPHEINPEWRQWHRDLLPMLPNQWPLVIYEKTKEQFDVVRKILNSPRISGVVCATDAGREGELIFRYIYEAQPSPGIHRTGSPAPLSTSASVSSSGKPRVHSSNPCSASSALSG